jgi:hypothetical protein
MARQWLRGVISRADADPATGEHAGEVERDEDRTLPTRGAPTLPPWFALLPLNAATELECCAECLARLRVLEPSAQKRALEFIVTHLETQNGVKFGEEAAE